MARASHVYAGPACPHCGAPLKAMPPGSAMEACSACRRAFEATRFAPPERAASVKRLADAGPGAETACASHPLNAAVTNCQRCGLLMCELCRIEADEKVLCPACFDRLSSEGALMSTRTTFRDYGRQASTLALAGLLLFYFGFLLGPAAVVYAIRALGQRRELGESGSLTRPIVALVLGLMETAIGGYFIWSLLRVG